MVQSSMNTPTHTQAYAMQAARFLPSLYGQAKVAGSTRNGEEILPNHTADSTGGATPPKCSPLI